MAAVRNAPVVAVMNLKGGVGKTTLSANVFREFQRTMGKSVLLIDFDPQFNLTQLLVKESLYESLVSDNKTLLSVVRHPEPLTIFHVSESDLSTIEQTDSYIHRLAPKARTAIDLVPGDFRIATYNLKEDQSFLRLARQRIAALMAQARKEYDIVVIDCNPSVSFLTRTALENCSHLLVPVRPDRYSLRGLQMLDEYVAGIPTIIHSPKRSIILNDVDDATSEYVRQIRTTDYATDTLAHAVPYSKYFRPRAGYVGFAVDKGGPHSTILQTSLKKIAQELQPRLGI